MLRIFRQYVLQDAATIGIELAFIGKKADLRISGRNLFVVW